MAPNRTRAKGDEESQGGEPMALPLQTRAEDRGWAEGLPWDWAQLVRSGVQVLCFSLVLVLLTVYCNELLRFYAEQSVAKDVLSEERCNNYQKRYRYEMYGYDDCKRAEIAYDRMSIVAALQNMILRFVYFCARVVRDVTFRLEVVIALIAITTPLLSLRRFF